MSQGCYSLVRSSDGNQMITQICHCTFSRGFESLVVCYSDFKDSSIELWEGIKGERLWSAVSMTLTTSERPFEREIEEETFYIREQRRKSIRP